MSSAPWIKGEPVLGSLRAFAKDRLGFFEAAARLGDVVGFNLGGRSFFLLAHPDAVKRVLVDNYPNYRKETRGQDLLRTVLGEGLVTAEGDTWKRQRRLSQPAFHKDLVASFAPLMVRATREALEGWQPGQELDVSEAMGRLTLTIVGRALMGTDLSDSASEVGAALTHVLNELSARSVSILDFFIGTEVPTLRNRRLKQAIATLDRVVDATIAERRRDPSGHHDLLALLMAARDEEGGTGGMSDRLLRDQIMTMILAGHETTANALTWTFYLLSKHPAVERRARAEVASVLGDRDATFEDAMRLRYVRAVIDESMRLFPPVWTLARSVVADDEIGGVKIPGGSFVFACQWITHRHPAIWDNPEGFDPERFLVESPDRPRFAYFPFGGGARQCIGNTFALMEAQLILATVLQSFRLDLLPGTRAEPEPLMTLRPRGGLHARLVGRGDADASASARLPLAVAGG